MCGFLYFFFFKQKTAYEMRISDWSSDVCSSDLLALATRTIAIEHQVVGGAHRISERVGDRDSALFRQAHPQEIGRASCREKSVSVRVDLGGRRIIKKKKINK